MQFEEILQKLPRVLVLLQSSVTNGAENKPQTNDEEDILDKILTGALFGAVLCSVVVPKNARILINSHLSSAGKRFLQQTVVRHWGPLLNSVIWGIWNENN